MTILTFNVKPIIDDPAIFAEWYEKMPAWRRRRIDSMKHESGKALSLGVGVLLHKALTEMGVEEPDEVCMNEFEKPFYKEYPEIHFSLSHSGVMAMCVISDRPVGCDVEKIRERDLDIAKRFFTSEEYDLIKSQKTDELQTKMFFRIWTLKESFVKCIGTGLSTPLNEFSIIPDWHGKITLNQTISNSEYNFVELNLDDGYKYSVCVKYPQT
ncbi:MAG: 4'-phosphopantetheinyl transferase superfamily protein [Paludibacteraceae bacterium]|nr:4'-phosphopantetheinyl transferase superfamily protein [Paludibacteraceae bacterium]